MVKKLAEMPVWRDPQNHEKMRFPSSWDKGNENRFGDLGTRRLFNAKIYCIFGEKSGGETVRMLSAVIEIKKFFESFDRE